jgi:hypothetical protein
MPGRQKALKPAHAMQWEFVANGRRTAFDLPQRTALSDVDCGMHGTQLHDRPCPTRRDTTKLPGGRRAACVLCGAGWRRAFRTSEAASEAFSQASSKALSKTSSRALSQALSRALSRALSQALSKES